MDYGIYAWPDKSIVVSNLILVDNKISLGLHVFGPNPLSHQARNNTITVQNSLLIGKSTNFDCVKDNVLPYQATVYSHRSPRATGGKDRSLIEKWFREASLFDDNTQTISKYAVVSC